jgi:hypothetical protein
MQSDKTGSTAGLDVDPQVVQIPEPVVVAGDGKAVEEWTQTFAELKNRRLDYTVRKWASGCALLLIVGMYLVGICLAALYVPQALCAPTETVQGTPPTVVIKSCAKLDSSAVHLLVATWLALFTVPTVLLISLLRSATAGAKVDVSDTTLHGQLGERVMKFIDAAIDRLNSK